MMKSEVIVTIFLIVFFAIIARSNLIFEFAFCLARRFCLLLVRAGFNLLLSLKEPAGVVVAFILIIALAAMVLNSWLSALWLLITLIFIYANFKRR